VDESCEASNVEISVPVGGILAKKSENVNFRGGSRSFQLAAREEVVSNTWKELAAARERKGRRGRISPQSSQRTRRGKREGSRRFGSMQRRKTSGKAGEEDDQGVHGEHGVGKEPSTNSAIYGHLE
jgi:hypothetical protein